MAAAPAIRYVASSTRSALGSLHLQCHVKPRASKQREGIVSVSDSAVELCISAPAKDGEANKALKALLSKVLKCPKSDIEITRGSRSRDKTVAIAGIRINEDEVDYLSNIKHQLQNSNG